MKHADDLGVLVVRLPRLLRSGRERDLEIVAFAQRRRDLGQAIGVERIGTNDVTARTQGYSRRQVGEIVEATLAAIREQVQAGQNVTLTGFGTFRRSERAARTGTNIRTRERIEIPASTSVRFTPGSEFKAVVGGRKSRGNYATERASAGLGTARAVGGEEQAPRRQKGRAAG